MSAIPASPDTTSPSKSKKRKLDSGEHKSASKKRKHDKEPTSEPVQEPEAAKPTSEKKRKKKQSQEAKAVTEETRIPETITNGAAPDVTDDVHIADTTDEQQDPAPPSDKKKKKKKSRHTNTASPPPPPSSTKEEDASPIIQSPPLPDPDPDILLPDAPSLAPDTTAPLIADLLTSPSPSPFHSTRLSLYLPLPAIALSPTHALSSLLAQHLSPLLLTYFPPAHGIVLAYSDPTLSACAGTNGLGAALRPPTTSDPTTSAADLTNEARQREILAKASDDFGAAWTWLTATFLVFRPERAQEMVGWTNVTSDGFIGVVAYNYFQAAIGKSRIPEGWSFVGAGGADANTKKRWRKGRLERGVAASQEEKQGEEGKQGTSRVFGHRQGDGEEEGYFVDEKGEKVPEVLRFRVVDTEMVPAHEQGSLTLQIDATLLDEEAEKKVVAEEQDRWERQQKLRGKGRTVGEDVVMSGGLGRNRQGSAVLS